MAFFTRGRRSWSPVSAVILNLPPLTRSTFGAMLLLGVLPHQVKDYNALIRALLQPYRTLGMIAGEGQTGFVVFNAHTQTNIAVFIEVVLGEEDSKGLPRICGHHGSGYIGACPYCMQEGFRCVGSQYYPGALAYVTDPAILQMCRKHLSLGKDEVKVPPLEKNPTPEQTYQRNVDLYRNQMVRLCNGVKPKPHTLRTLRASLRSLSNRSKLPSQVPFHHPCVYTEFWPDFDPVKQCIAGVAHGICNFVEDAADLVMNKTQMRMSTERTTWEHAVGRDPGSSIILHASTARLGIINELLRTLKVCRGWPSLPHDMAELSTLKMELTLDWAGAVGQYFFALLDVSPIVRDNLVKVLRALSGYQQKLPQQNLKDLHALLVTGLGTLEFIAPSHWATGTKHLLVHILDCLTEYGSFWVLNELKFETYGGMLKKLAKTGTKNRLFTLALNVLSLQKSDTALYVRARDPKYAGKDMELRVFILLYICAPVTHVP